MSKSVKRLVVGMTGASGQIYGIRLLQVLRETAEIETHLVMSQAACLTIPQETDWSPDAVAALADVVYKPNDVGAAIASGSFSTAGMIIAPCSIKSLAAVAHSFNADLISRAADVQLKEGRPVLLMVRETPLHLGHLDLMRQAARIGYVIYPPVPAFYSRPRTLDDLVDGTVGRMLARIGLDNTLYYRWTGLGAPGKAEQK